jgi:hypothetical protein
VNNRVVIGAVILVGGVILFGVGGLLWSATQPRERGEPVDITFDQVDPKLWSVRLRGIAHYGPRIRLKTAATLGAPETVMWAYPLFPIDAPATKEIKVLVRSAQEPPTRVDLEYIEVEGWLDPIQPATFPFTAKQGLEKNGYFLADGAVVLESWGQRSIDPAEVVP